MSNDFFHSYEREREELINRLTKVKDEEIARLRDEMAKKAADDAEAIAQAAQVELLRFRFAFCCFFFLSAHSPNLPSLYPHSANKKAELEAQVLAAEKAGADRAELEQLRKELRCLHQTIFQIHIC